MYSERKLFFAWNEEKEMEYLQDMARKGYHLDHVNFFKYHFVEKEADDCQYAADFKGFNAMPEEEYIQLFKDGGWTFVTRFGAWYYFKSHDLNAVMYNDVESIKEKYKKLLKLLLLTGFPLYYQMIIFFPNLSDSELAGFYSGFRIFVYILSLVHMLALWKIFNKYRKISKCIHQ